MQLKHGRIAMLAVLGMIVQESYHPVVPAAFGPAIIHFQMAQVFQPWLVLYFLVPIAMIEMYNVFRGWETPSEKQDFTALLRDDYVPGDLGFDPLRILGSEWPKWGSFTPFFKDIRTKELNHCRLAMLAVAGIVTQELIDGNTVLGHLQKFGLGPAKVLS